ncbi:ATP-dependent sacrificial sulfur transferase LarE [Halorubrum sp. BOL3-1]|uniref:ATP-dependent sacrificial sulfur transferase LarE n=1 Tax=Halorubrum sp. BOL3-1 TaxID=2497325 RepID=UPI001005039C|nr:ATP-dependent sacrificial sulfur transferase LarE [Halorubrum sp. BOL3-1]QAU13188.1 ATP-dependent sacrificial sulfur transferase LarE [Halorubrum sp. BOL3-1]
MSEHARPVGDGSLDPETAAKARSARDALGERDGVLVAFSGGVDSSVVAALARDALGGDAVACTARSETLPAAELGDAKRVAGEVGIRHETVTFSELDDPEFVANDGDRCYHCRTMRLGRMYETARDLGIDTVCDGTNADDPGEGHRPGLRAVEELDVFSPLLDAGISKEEVRAVAESYDLSVSDKPSMACLSSRIPTGLEVTEERLTRIEKAERVLREWGFEGFRVRDHDGLARVEIAPDELERALDPAFADAVHEHLTDLGFEYVTLDMAGYRTGSVSPGGADEGGSNGADGTDGERGSNGADDDRESGEGTDDGVDIGRRYPR